MCLPGRRLVVVSVYGALDAGHRHIASDIRVLLAKVDTSHRDVRLAVNWSGSRTELQIQIGSLQGVKPQVISNESELNGAMLCKISKGIKRYI